MNKQLQQNIINWITIVIWIWYLSAQWLSVPIFQSWLKFDIIIAFTIFGLQILSYCDIKKIVTFHDKEMNMIFVISAVTGVCLILSKSRIGAFFTVFNYCILWYLSDKWYWSKIQLAAVSGTLFMIFIKWLIFPIPGFNPNGIGTVTVFSMFSIVAMVDYLIKNKRICLSVQAICILLSLQQVVKYRGRGTLLCLLVYIIIRFFIPRQLWLKRNLYKLFCFMVTLGSIVFVFVYTAVWAITKTELNISIFHKNLYSGREEIWYEVWNIFKQQPLIGTGSNLILESWPVVNIHNAMYDILIVHGVIVFGLFLFYIIWKKMKIHKINMHNPFFITTMAGIFAVYVEGFSDMDLFWTPLMLVWCFLIVILNSLRKFHETNEGEE